MIRVEVVSSHFGYKEEYVLSKTPFWLARKFEQADRERYEERIGASQSVFRGISLALDVVFNKGKGAAEIMPSYDDAIKMLKETAKEKEEEEFNKEIWWKPRA